MSAASQALPLRTMTSPWRDLDADRLDGRRGRVARLLGELLAERRVRDDERGDRARRRASARPRRARRPCGWSGGSGSAATSVSRSSVRSVRIEDARGLGADRGPALRRRVRRASPGARRDRSGTPSRAATARSSGVRSAAKAVSTRSTRRLERPSPARRRWRWPFSVVKSYCGSTASRAAGARLASVGRRSRTSSRPRRRRCPGSRELARPCTGAVSSGRMSTPRIAVRARTRIPEAIAGASRRCA